MAQFPLVLAIEPRLLPYARLNGFSMDRKVCEVDFSGVRPLMMTSVQYRNFVFRRMFEKPAMMFEARTVEIMKNVRELSRLDPEYESVARLSYNLSMAHAFCVSAYSLQHVPESYSRSRDLYGGKDKRTRIYGIETSRQGRCPAV